MDAGSVPVKDLETEVEFLSRRLADCTWLLAAGGVVYLSGGAVSAFWGNPVCRLGITPAWAAVQGVILCSAAFAASHRLEACWKRLALISLSLLMLVIVGVQGLQPTVCRDCANLTSCTSGGCHLKEQQLLKESQFFCAPKAETGVCSGQDLVAFIQTTIGSIFNYSCVDFGQFSTIAFLGVCAAICFCICERVTSGSLDKHQWLLSRMKNNMRVMGFSAASREGTTLDPQMDCNGANDDCLPPDTLVWALGEEDPVPLSLVKSGMQVLTYDPTRKKPIAYKAVERIGLHRDGLKQRWVRVDLADGSEVMMTAAHPVWSDESNGGVIGPLQAEHLVPGQDCLPVYSVRPIPVRSVTPVPLHSCPTGRLSIKLVAETDDIAGDSSTCASRCTVLAATLGGIGGAPTSYVAVGDARAKPATTRLEALNSAFGLDMVARGGASQLDFFEQDAAACGMRRSNSESALDVLKATIAFNSQQREFDQMTTSSVTGSHSKSDVVSSHGSSMSDVSSGRGTEVILGGADGRSSWDFAADGSWQRTVTKEAPAVRLNAIRELPIDTNGKRLSFGSLGHKVNGEQCKVCVFNRKNAAGCRHGVLCTFCHADHQPYVRPPRKQNERLPIHGSQRGKGMGRLGGRGGDPKLSL